VSLRGSLSFSATLVDGTLILENSTSTQFSAAVVQKMNSLVGKRASKILVGK